MFRKTCARLHQDTCEAKRKLSNYKEKVQSAVEVMNGKTVSRAKTLLKVDTEYLRRTIPPQAEAIPEDCK